MDSIKSNVMRDSEVENYVTSDHFVYYYHQALSRGLGGK